MPELNRRAFLASIAAALVLAAKPEVVCAWCKGTGSRDYNYWDPVRFVTYVYRAECDACGERALWVPGRKLISIPAPPFLSVGDVLTFSPGSERYIVTTEARSLARIGDARFRIDGAPSGYLLPHMDLYCGAWPPGVKPTITRGARPARF